MTKNVANYSGHIIGFWIALMVVANSIVAHMFYCGLSVKKKEKRKNELMKYLIVQSLEFAGNKSKNYIKIIDYIFVGPFCDPHRLSR